MSNGFGTPSYGNDNGKTFWKNFRLKTPDAAKGEVKTSFVCLIVPPMKSLAENGKWAMYHGQHFGYSGVDPRDPSKQKMRPFACIEKTDFRTKMVTVECPACDEIRTKEAEKERRAAEYKSQGLSEGDVRERLDPLTQWLKRHNCDRKWHINVLTQEGEYGVLQISHTLKKALDAKMDELRSKRKVDPIVEGVWFEFTRMGKFPVQDAVEVFMIEGDDGSFRMKKAPLTDEQGAKALEILPDLSKDTVKMISAQQIQLIVQSSGDPEEIDRIWQMGTKTEKRERTPAPQTQKPAPAPAAKNPQDEIAALQARLAALQSQQAKPADAPVAPVAQSAPTTTPAPAGGDAEMSDEEFYSRFGVK